MRQVSEETYQVVEQEQPDIIIVDLHLRSARPDWDPIEQLRRDPATQQIPLIVTSTDPNVLEAKPMSCRQNCETLAMPFDLNALLAKITKLIYPPPV